MTSKPVYNSRAKNPTFSFQLRVGKYMKSHHIQEVFFKAETSNKNDVGYIKIGKENQIAAKAHDEGTVTLPAEYKDYDVGICKFADSNCHVFRLDFVDGDDKKSKINKLKNLAYVLCGGKPEFDENSPPKDWCKWGNICKDKECKRDHHPDYTPECLKLKTERGCRDLHCQFYHPERKVDCRNGASCRGLDVYCKFKHPEQSAVAAPVDDPTENGGSVKTIPLPNGTTLVVTTTVVKTEPKVKIGAKPVVRTNPRLLKE